MVSARDKLVLPERVGGALVLDFVNTRDAWLSEPHKREFLRDHAALVAWALAAGAIDAAPPRPRDAAALHRRALDLRLALFRVFAPLASARGRTPARWTR